MGVYGQQWKPDKQKHPCRVAEGTKVGFAAYKTLASQWFVLNLTFAGASTCDEGLVVCSCGTPRTQAGFGGKKQMSQNKGSLNFEGHESPSRGYQQNRVTLDFRAQDTSIPFQVFACAVNPTGWFHRLHFFDQTGQNPRRQQRRGHFCYPP